MPSDTKPRAELSFDGCGINGPDEYRSRLCTFTQIRSTAAKRYGPLFAAAPGMVGIIQSCVYQMEQCEKMFRDDPEFMAALNEARDMLTTLRQSNR